MPTCIPQHSAKRANLVETNMAPVEMVRWNVWSHVIFLPIHQKPSATSAISAAANGATDVRRIAPVVCKELNSQTGCSKRVLQYLLDRGIPAPRQLCYNTHTPTVKRVHIHSCPDTNPLGSLSETRDAPVVTVVAVRPFAMEITRVLILHRPAPPLGTLRKQWPWSSLNPAHIHSST